MKITVNALEIKHVRLKDTEKGNLLAGILYAMCYHDSFLSQSGTNNRTCFLDRQEYLKSLI